MCFCSSVFLGYGKNIAFCLIFLETKNLLVTSPNANTNIFDSLFYRFSFVFLLNRWYWLWNVGSHESFVWAVCLEFHKTTSQNRPSVHLFFAFAFACTWTEMHRAAFFAFFLENSINRKLNQMHFVLLSPPPCHSHTPTLDSNEHIVCVCKATRIGTHPMSIRVEVGGRRRMSAGDGNNSDLSIRINTDNNTKS